MEKNNWGDGILCKVFAVQPQRPEFGSQHLYLGEAVCTYNPSTGRWEQLDSEGLVARKSGSRLTQRTCFKNKAEPERGTVHL